MKSKLRRTLAIILAAVMLLSVFPAVGAFAANGGKCGENVQWKIDKNGTLTISGKGKMNDYNSKPKGEDLNLIMYGSDTPWVKQRENVKKIIIKGDVTYIGANAFSGFTALKSVKITAKVKTIGEWAFGYSKALTDVELPDGVVTVKSGAFSNCLALVNINLPKSLKTIEDSVFCNCRKLKNLKLPSGLTKIGDAAFKFCKSFTKITLPEKITSVNDEVFAWCANLKDIRIPDGVKYIGARAFIDNKSLENIALPGKLEKIGAFAFAGCDKLTSIRIPKSVKKIKNFALGYSSEEGNGIYDYEKISDSFVIYGYKNSAAQKYAKKNDISFKSVGKVGKVYLSKTNLEYNGKAQKPTVVAKDSKGNRLKLGTDYTVKYSKGCKNVGQYTVTVTFIGKYSGTKKLSFKIVPTGTKITKLSAGNNSLKVKWAKQTEQTTGYELRYATASNMKNAKTLTIDKNESSKKLTKLESGKKYFVGIRTYKTVKLNGKSVRLYSSWSKTESIKIK